MVSLTDWLATFADMSGLKLAEDAGEDSVSIMPLLKGSNEPVRQSVIHHSASGKFAIRHQDWLFIDYKTGDGNRGKRKEPDWLRKERGVLSHRSSAELFNLKEDAQQTRNLYDQHPEKARELEKLLEKLNKGNDELNL